MFGYYPSVLVVILIGKTVFKRTHIDELMNKLVLVVSVLHLVFYKWLKICTVLIDSGFPGIIGDPVFNRLVGV